MDKYCVGLFGGILLLILGLFPDRVGAQPSVDPAQNSIVARATDTVTVTFDSQITVPSDTDTLSVFGSQFGRHEGTIEVNSNTIRFISDCSFRPGETVTVTVSDDISAPSTPYVWQFTVRSEYGNGQFSKESPVSLSQGGQGSEPAKLGSVVIPSEPYAADFNRPLNESDPGDLLTDVAFVNQEEGEVQVLYGPDFDGSNSQAISVPEAKTLAGGDINGDGLPDLVTVNSFTDALGVLINQGGSFALEQTIETGSRPTDVTVADLNGDGARDLAVAPFGESLVYVHLNDGTGSFESSDTYPSSAAPTSVVARDLNRNGHLDLLVGSTGEDKIDWLINEGQGDFPQNGPNGSIDLPFTPASLVANDVSGNEGATTGDGRVDLIVSAQSESQILLYENNGTQPLSFSEQSIPSSPDGPALGATLADLDSGPETEQGTFDLDLISSHRSSDELQAVFNNSNDGYGTTSPFSSSDPTGVVGFDVDRNESQDFLAINPRGTRAQLFRNQGGRPGPVSLSENLLQFEICVGNNGKDTVRVQNVSNNEVVLSESSAQPPDGFEVTTTLPDTLRPGETASVEVTFSPDKIANFSGTLELQANELTKFCGKETEPIDLPIEVQGTGEGTNLSATPNPLEFGEVIVGDSTTESFQISNDGNVPAEITDVTGLEGTPFKIQSPPSDIPDVPEEGQVQVTAEFRPENPNNTFTEAVSLITSSDCGKDTVEVVLTGRSRPQRPDLVAAFAGDPPTNVNISDTLDTRCEFSNQGGGDVENSFSVEINPDGAEPTTFTGLSVDDSPTPPVPVSFSEEGRKEVTCTVDSEDKVVESDEDNNIANLDITVERPDQLPVSPNPFTPNNDPFNDCVQFRLGEFGLEQATVEIYTFQGRLVRTLDERSASDCTNGIDNGALAWDGVDDNGERMPPGVYAYVVRDGGQTVASGHITLAR